MSKHGRWTVTIDSGNTDSLCASDNICRDTFELEIIYICRYPSAEVWYPSVGAQLNSLNTADIKEYGWRKKTVELPSRTDITLSEFHLVTHKVTNDPEGNDVGL